MKTKVLWNSLGAATAVLVAAGIAGMAHVGFYKGQTDVPLKDVAPDAKRFPQFIQTAQGQWLYFRKWIASEPKAVVFLAHGVGEHSGRYDHVARFLTNLGITVYVVDHQGHGQSTGTRTYFEKFQDVVDDFLFFIQSTCDGMSAEEKALPRFLFGHSMGGAVVIHSALMLKDSLQGVIISAPMVAADPSVATPTKITMAKMLSRLFPKFPIGKLEIKKICSDPVVVRKTELDRLYDQRPLAARVAYEFILEMEYLQSVAKDVKFPYFLFYGGDDTITSVEGISLWHGKTQSTDKTMTVYPGLFHEVMNERESETVLNSVAQWIKDHL